MRRFFSSTILVFLIVCSFAQGAYAQACGKYFISVVVQSLDGKAVRNGQVVLRPIDRDETRGKGFLRDGDDPSTFSIDYPEGYSFRTPHTLVVSAPGFITVENRVTFISCQSRRIVVGLARTDSAGNAIWQFENNVDVEVVGEDGKDLNNAKLTISGPAGNTSVMDMKFGMAYFTLANGEYIFRFDAPGYEPGSEKVDLTSLENKHLKIALKSHSKP